MRQRFKWRVQNDIDAEEKAAAETDTTPVGASLTNQSFKKDTDLNVILKRFGVHDSPVPTPQGMDFYNQPVADFGEGISLQEILDTQRRATEHFDALPATLKKKFQNSPAQLHKFVMDPANTDEAVKLGLLKKTTPPPAESSTDTPK